MITDETEAASVAERKRSAGAGKATLERERAEELNLGGPVRTEWSGEGQFGMDSLLNRKGRRAAED